MSILITHLKVFIASPSDVNDERRIVREIVNELNTTYSKLLGYHLDVIGWETDVFPAFGEDPQDVINKQINDDYDIFIGIMWSRFGTPTKRETSATKEEFERAHEKAKNSNNPIYLLLYFKDQPIQPSVLDLIQLKNVMDFKDHVSKSGGLYKTFNTTEEFQNLLRINLQQTLQDYHKKNSSQTSNTPVRKEKTLTNINEETIEDEDLGLFEHLNIATISMAEVNGSIHKITDYIVHLSKKMNEYSNEMKLVQNKPQALQQAEAIRLINSFSTAMLNFSSRIRTEIPIINNQFQDVITHYNNALNIYYLFYSDTDNTEVATSINDFIDLKESIKGSVEEILGLKEIINTYPPLTGQLTKAKKETIKILNELANEFIADVNLIEEVVQKY